MLILEHDVLEVILVSFMDHLKPAINGEILKQFSHLNYATLVFVSFKKLQLQL